MSLLDISAFALYRIILGTIVLSVFGIILGLAYKGVDRKLSARMQGRIGPPLRQPFWDVKKLFAKENVVPDNAIPWVFNLAPLIGLVGTISLLLYLPIGGFPPLISWGGDLLLILYLLMVPSLAMVVGGFSSGSPYATVGAQREMTAMIAYEFPLAIILIGVAWFLLQHGVGNVFAVSTIIGTPVWGIVGPLGFIGFLLFFVILMIVTPGELAKIPFDAQEAETEIAGGLLVEYSGRNLAMFYLTDGVKTVVMASLVVTLFFSYNLMENTSYVAYAVNITFYLVKVLLVILFSVTLVRVGFARLKIDQLVYMYWVPLTLLGLAGLICVMWDGWMMTQFHWKSLVDMLGAL